MIDDAKDGKIDLILTKSISRFARNTVDSLTTIRFLKEKGVEVYFEKENIWTLDSKGELLITLMSSLAQEESRSLSENVKWGKRKRFQDGVVSMPYGGFLGFRKGRDGRPEIIPEEAKIVKRIFKEFLLGSSYRSIAKGLAEDGIKSPRGKDEWPISTIKSMLQNEKYKGDALLQKSFVVDFLTKRTKENEGEVPQYYVENSHEAIISDKIFEMTQQEIANRKKNKAYGSSVNFLSGRIFCGCCGEAFTRKVWHSTSKYKRYIWQCGKKYHGESLCTTPHLTEDEIKEAFVKMLNQLVKADDTVLKLTRYAIDEVLDTTKDREQAVILADMVDELYEKLTKQLIRLGQSKSENPEERQAYETDMAEYQKLHDELQVVKNSINDKEKRRFSCKCFLESVSHLNNEELHYSEELWVTLVEYAKVSEGENRTLVFHLRNGQTFSSEV